MMKTSVIKTIVMFNNYCIYNTEIFYTHTPWRLKLLLEVLQSRKERILNALKERKPYKPYALQLLEARAVANNIDFTSHVPEQQGDRTESVQETTVQIQRTEASSQRRKSKVPWRIVNRRKRKRSVRPPSKLSVNAVPSPDVNATHHQPVVQQQNTFLMSATTQTPALLQAQDNADIKEVTPAKEEIPQKPTESDDNVPLSNPPSSKISSACQVSAPHLPTQPTLSIRQSVSALFMKPNPLSTAISKSKIKLPIPSFGDLLESIEKAKRKQDTVNPSQTEDKIKYGIKDMVQHQCNASVQYDREERLSTQVQANPLDYGQEDNYKRRHMAEVDRLTDSLISKWPSRTASTEQEKELSLLSYGEPAKSVVPHRPISLEGHHYVNMVGVLVSPDCPMLERWRKVGCSNELNDPWMGKRCRRHRPK